MLPNVNSSCGCKICSVQFSRSVVSDSLWFQGPHTPGIPVHHQLPESTQTHLHWVGDAIQPSHPLSSPSPPAPNLSQHQGLFKWVSSLHQVAKVFEFQLQHVGCCNVPPKFPFTNKWFFSLVAGNASGFLWILPWPGEFPYPKAIHPVWGSKHPMSAQCKKSHGFFCRMGNSEGLNYELAVGSAEAWLFSLPNPISFPSHPQT